MKVNSKQLDAVLALSAPNRYKHFVKVVSDWQEVWGLYDDGWALAATDDGQMVFPMWPAKEYAELCARDKWASYVPKAFSLDDLLNELLPKLRQDNALPGVFFTPQSKGITPAIDQLIGDIKIELENY